jgi:cytochrome P450
VPPRPRALTDPEKFEPLRFSPEQAKGRHPCAYIPFGGGQRKCIGASVASMEATLVLARLAQRFHVEVAPGVSVRPRPSFALRPRDGVPVRLRAL